MWHLLSHLRNFLPLRVVPCSSVSACRTALTRTAQLTTSSTPTRPCHTGAINPKPTMYDEAERALKELVPAELVVRGRQPGPHSPPLKPPPSSPRLSTAACRKQERKVAQEAASESAAAAAAAEEERQQRRIIELVCCSQSPSACPGLSSLLPPPLTHPNHHQAAQQSGKGGGKKSKKKAASKPEGSPAEPAVAELDMGAVLAAMTDAKVGGHGRGWEDRDSASRRRVVSSLLLTSCFSCVQDKFKGKPIEWVQAGLGVISSKLSGCADEFGDPPSGALWMPLPHHQQCRYSPLPLSPRTDHGQGQDQDAGADALPAERQNQGALQGL